MLIVADTHVHAYTGLQGPDPLRRGAENLRVLATALPPPRGAAHGGGVHVDDDADGPIGAQHGGDRGETVLVVLLTEVAGCDYFGSLPGPDRVAGGAQPTVFATDEPGGVELRWEDGLCLIVVAGRQVVTRERLEVLGLGVSAEIADGMPVGAAIAAVRGAGGVPVLSWAPGKWTFSRREVVEETIERGSPEEFVIGDTTLRPSSMAEPKLMRWARERGFKIIAGTDPLPISGEEGLIGTYGVACAAEFERRRPVSSVRDMFLDPEVAVSIVGERGSLAGIASRLIRHRLTGRAT